MIRKITKKSIDAFVSYLFEEEKSNTTTKKYARDIEKLRKYAKNRDITKNLMIEYKDYLCNTKKYKISSIKFF